MTQTANINKLFPTQVKVCKLDASLQRIFHT
jgi:hypothetical protein